MGRMTGEAGQFTGASAEALALLEIRRLVPNVPRIGEVVRRFPPIRGPVACTAEVQDSFGRHRFRISDRLTRRRLDVTAAGPVARFATHPGFGDDDLLPRRYGGGTGGMALETAADWGTGTAQWEGLPRGFHRRSRGEALMAGSKVEGVRPGIEGEGMFEVCRRSHAADEGDAVGPRTECPVERDFDFRPSGSPAADLDAKFLIGALERELKPRWPK